MIFVEHDMDVVQDISDWVVVMAEGAIIAEGTPDDIAAERRGDRRLPRAHAPTSDGTTTTRSESSTRDAATGGRRERRRC